MFRSKTVLYVYNDAWRIPKNDNVLITNILHMSIQKFAYIAKMVGNFHKKYAVGTHWNCLALKYVVRAHRF